MRTVINTLAISLLFSLILVFTSVCVSAEDAAAAVPMQERTRLSQEAGDALSASKASLGLQTELPAVDMKIPPDRQRIWEAPNEMPEFGRFPISEKTATVILYGSIALIAVALVFSLRYNLWSASRARRMEHGEEMETSAPAAAASRMEKAQVEADVLAQQGDFAEAMHILLLQSIGELRRRLCVPISVSLTSREILRAIALSSEGRTVFADIIGRVEISYFGTHRPGADEYMACRRSFDALTDILRRGNPL